MEHKFSYEWTLKDANFTKNKGVVFSCFSCGGGSTMGYKLAGFDVIGCNEIDPKLMKTYITNFHPKYSYLEDIRIFKKRNNLPKELYNLDILDGSPPCSTFSMAGNREKDWGKKKKFREGQAEQILDDLFFDFIDLAKKLQSKIVVAENVKGILLGNAKKYVRKIYKEFDKAGYHCQHWLLDASRMGVPQKRQRVFFICLRKDLAKQFLYQKDLFTIAPKLNLKFNEKEITVYKAIKNINNIYGRKLTKIAEKIWIKTKIGDSAAKVKEGSWFSRVKIDPSKPSRTITGHSSGDFWYWNKPYYLNEDYFQMCGTFPIDYNFCNNRKDYLCGMSVPPVMMAQIATEIYDQWLLPIKHVV